MTQDSGFDDNTVILQGDVEWRDYDGMDDAIHTTPIHDNDWEAALVVAMCLMMSTARTKRIHLHDSARPTLSAHEAMSSVKDLLDFARVVIDAAMLDAATSLQNIVEIHCGQAVSARQTTRRYGVT